MKLIYFLLFFFLLLGNSCSKEYSIEKPFSFVANGTLKDSAGSCQSFIANGGYIKDSVLTDSNYINVVANIFISRKVSNRKFCANVSPQEDFALFST